MKFQAFPSPSGHGWVSARQTYCGGWIAVHEHPSQMLALIDAQNLQGEYEAEQEARQRQAQSIAGQAQGLGRIPRGFYGPEHGDCAD